ncbi:MAG: AgmX/PglI C-terminal domain-containing protein [Acidobacteriota bacterium]
MSAPAPTSHDKAIEIAAMLGDSVVDVKHCLDPRGGKVSTRTWTLLAVGAACLLAAVAAFAASVHVAAANSRDLAYWTHTLHKPAFAYRPQQVSPLLDWLAFGGFATGLGAVIVSMLRMRDERRSPYFRIGTAPGVELPLEGAPSACFPLVAPRGDDFMFNFGPGIEGELFEGGNTTTLASLAASGRAQPSPHLPGVFELAIPDHARISVRAGKAKLLVTAVERPRRHAVPLVAALESRVMTYFAGSLAAHLGIWALLQLVPEDGGAANIDLSMIEGTTTRSASTANETQPPKPDQGDGTDGTDGGGGQAAGAEGAAGITMAADPAPRMHVQNRGAEEAQLTREQVRELAAHSGILGDMPELMQGVHSVAATEDFASAFDTSDNPGSLFDGTGDGGGGFGIGRNGFGAGGGCMTPPCGYGAGPYHTIGFGTRAGDGYGVAGGHGPGLPGHKTKVPSVYISQANVIGEYDKSIIRRYIKRNLDKITYCYERQLLAHPGLAGEIQVQFFIQPDGSVGSSAGKGMDSTVATCVADVVKTIEFPAPRGGVQVNYPFTFRAAAG